jgi:hypothetical protein
VPKNVVGKSITTNPGYFSSGRFLHGEGVKRLLFSQLGSLVKVKRFQFYSFNEIDCIKWILLRFQSSNSLNTICSPLPMYASNMCMTVDIYLRSN